MKLEILFWYKTLRKLINSDMGVEPKIGVIYPKMDGL